MSLKSRFVGLFLALGLFAATGCQTVRPWEKGVLADKSMNASANNEACSEDFVRHSFDVREASVGGSGHAGGGCGCN